MGRTVSLVDGFGRVHRDLRISLTDKCSLRCTYCMPAEGVPWIERDSILTTDEIERVARVCVSLGVTTIRLTGGEPLVRKDAVEVVRRLAALGPEVSMTTNGLRLAELAVPLREAGLTRLNISIDTLDAERFATLTRRDRLGDVLAGIEAAREAGFTPLKLNAVAMRGVNDDELVDLVEFARGAGAQMRFIEQMPLDAGHTWDRAAMVPGAEILQTLRTRFDLEPVAGRGSSPADLWTIDGGPATVGVIASVTAPFCAACDRIRITADGHVRNCLFARDESDLVPVLRGGGTDADLARIFESSIAAKRAGHGIDSPTFVQPTRPMSAIGG
nr:GTP 3',8-cyclase MoaA [Aeromicrobium duanguangcaii]